MILKKIISQIVDFIGINNIISIRNLLLSRNKIMDGPFKGMKYYSFLHSKYGMGNTHQRLFGTYEKELHQYIDLINQNKPELIINVGGGDGYYGVGLKLNNQNAKIIIFEKDRLKQKLISQLLIKNGIGNSREVYGECTTSKLRKNLLPRSTNFVIMDVEGAEKDILSDEIVLVSDSTYFLIEIHDHIEKGIGSKIINRFNNTHNISNIPFSGRNYDDFDKTGWLVDILPQKYNLQCIWEKRPKDQYWLYMEPKISK